jgi:hypothetical protein
MGNLYRPLIGICEIRFVYGPSLHGVASPMGEKTLKGKKRDPVNRLELALESRQDESTECTTVLDSFHVESLVRSHAELCTALRLAGRQILRLNGDPESLDRIRQVLKNAEELRKPGKDPERAETVIPTPPPEANTETAAATSQTKDAHTRRPGRRLSRPHPHRILRFPTGDSSH